MIKRASRTHLVFIVMATFSALLITTAKAESLKIRLVEIIDSTGFESPMRAASSMLPESWSTQGGVIWKVRGDECAGGYQLEWQASSSDGKAFITIYPNISWRTSTMPVQIPKDCIAGNFNSADEFMSAYMTQVPDGKVVEVQRDPRQLQQFSAMNYEMPGDPYTKSWIDYASITVEYTRENIEYMSVVNIFTLHNYMRSGHSFGTGMVMETAYGGAFMMNEFAAPKNSFNDYVPAFLMFQRNYLVDPAWQARINQMNRKMAKDNLDTSRKIGQINAQTSAEISSMSMDSWRKKQESDTHLSRETSEMIFGEETYKADTPSGQIALPNGYDKAYQLQDGSFVITNDNFFDPSRDAGQDGTLLKPVE